MCMRSSYISEFTQRIRAGMLKLNASRDTTHTKKKRENNHDESICLPFFLFFAATTHTYRYIYMQCCLFVCLFSLGPSFSTSKIFCCKLHTNPIESLWVIRWASSVLHVVLPPCPWCSSAPLSTSRLVSQVFLSGPRPCAILIQPFPVKTRGPTTSNSTLAIDHSRMSLSTVMIPSPPRLLSRFPLCV